MNEIITINNRKLYYQKYNPDQSWTKSIPGDKWVLVALVDREDKTTFVDLASNAIDHDVYYACCTGSYGELLHDYIDEIIVLRKIGAVEGHLPVYDIMTTWHNDGLSDALWFALYCSCDAGNVLMLDASEAQVEPVWDEIIAEWSQEN